MEKRIGVSFFKRVRLGHRPDPTGQIPISVYIFLSEYHYLGTRKPNKRIYPAIPNWRVCVSKLSPRSAQCTPLQRSKTTCFFQNSPEFWQKIAENHKALNPDFADMDPYDIFVDQIKSNFPLGRPQEPRDIGNAIAFLASEDASQITGQALNVNGGNILD